MNDRDNITNERTNERTNENSKFIYIRQATKLGYIPMLSGNVADLSYPTSKIRRGRVQGRYGNISPTLTCGGNAIYRVYREKTDKDNEKLKELNQEVKGKKKPKYKIRKITPRECGRLMNVDEESINKMLAAESNSQCYKAFGNSIVVACLCGIFSQLHIKGIKAWNDMTDDERYSVIYKGSVLEQKETDQYGFQVF